MNLERDAVCSFWRNRADNPDIVSSSFCGCEKGSMSVTLSIDLKPALSETQLDRRIQRDFEQVKRRQFKNSLNQLLPKSLIPVIACLSNIDPEKAGPSDNPVSGRTCEVV